MNLGENPYAKSQHFSGDIVACKFREGEENGRSILNSDMAIFAEALVCEAMGIDEGLSNERCLLSQVINRAGDDAPLFESHISPVSLSLPLALSSRLGPGSVPGTLPLLMPF